MPAVSEEYKNAKRAQIRRAALSKIQEKGIHGTSMSDVIKASGLSAGAIYSYYESKEALAVDIAREQILATVTTYAARADDHPADPATFVTSLLDHAPSDLVSGGVIVELWSWAARSEQISAFTQEAVGVFTRTVTDYLTRWHTQHGMDPDQAQRFADTVAPAVLALVHGFIIRRCIDPDFSPEHYRAAITALLTPGENLT